MSHLLNAIVAMDLYISMNVWFVFIVSPNMLNSRHLWVTKKKWVTAEKELSFSSTHTRTDEWARRASWVDMSKPPHFWWLVYSWWANQLDSPLGTYKLITFRQLCQATAMPKHESVLACAYTLQQHTWISHRLYQLKHFHSCWAITMTPLWIENKAVAWEN